MLDLHQLPFYALAGTQDAITLTQCITLRKCRCQGTITFLVYLPFRLAHFSSKLLNGQSLSRKAQALPLHQKSVTDKGEISMR
jgi:hypothetical protein